MIGSILGGAAGLITGLLGTGLNYQNQQESNDINERIARENMQMQRDLNAQNIAFQEEANKQNLAWQREANEQNLALARETNAQNESLMREGWARDDTAYTRKAADLANAGLSKTLAAGGSALQSQSVKLQTPSVQAQQMKAVDAGLAPHNDYKANPVFLDYANLAQMSQEFATKIAENKFLEERTATQKAQTKIANANATLIEARAKFADQLAQALLGSEENKANLANLLAQLRSKDLDNYNQFKNSTVHDIYALLQMIFGNGFTYGDGNFQYEQ